MKKKGLGLSRTIVVLGFVSLLTDLSTEMLIPIMPLFLQGVLGASGVVIGIIDGIAESVASLLKVVAGSLADRLGRPKLLTVLGYGLSSVAKPFLAVATIWPEVLAVRFTERFGKGIRSAPRDVIITESVEPENRGKAFGFHRAMDTTGAVLGPLVALLILRHYLTGSSASSRGPYVAIFLAAAIPALLAVAVLVAFVPERAKEKHPEARPRVNWGVLTPRLKRFLLVVGVFSVGNSSDAFLIIRAKDVLLKTMTPAGVLVTVLLMYVLFNTISAALSLPAGIVSDKVGRGPLLLTGMAIFALTYMGFGFVHSPAVLWVLFGIYGIYLAFTGGILRAFAADLAPRELRGTVIGAYYTIEGLALLPASIIAGVLWDRVSHSAPFFYGAVTAILATVLLVILLPREAESRRVEAV